MTDLFLGSASADRNSFFPHSRRAVSLLFLMNGFMMGTWAPKIPEFQTKLSISESQLGLMLFVFGVGSLMLMPVAGSQIARYGSRRVVLICAVLFVPTLLGVSLVGSVWTGAASLFLFGGLAGAMDVAMNANAVEVERRMRRSIMSSCHAFWSLGGLIGAAAGGFLISTTGVIGHAAVATAVAAGLLALAWPMILTDRPHSEEERPKARLPLSPLPWLIGLVALFSMIPEGAVLDWGAIYLREELGADLRLSGFAFAAFSLTMAIMRFAGDWVRDQLGAVKTLRICSLLSMTGLLVAGFSPTVGLAVFGFAIAGVGISNMVPIAFSAGGNIPGLAAGVGLSVVTTMGYSGILFAPSLIGFIAEHTALSNVYIGLSLFNLLVLAFSRHARHADARRCH